MMAQSNGTIATVRGAGGEPVNSSPTVSKVVGHGTPKVGILGYWNPLANAIKG
jgi:hypothetical protein